MLQYVYDNLDHNNFVLSLFLDFKKAFDSVNHAILITKLEKYGIRGISLDWFKSYLSERYQYVNINGINSPYHPIQCGVPQGSILGPLLFLIFIGDFPQCSTFFKFTLFADDSTLCCHLDVQPMCNIQQRIELELEPIQLWLDLNKIQLNANKSYFMIFNYRKEYELNPLKLGNNAIERCEYTKFLGINVDEKLSFKFHIDHIVNKISKTVGILFKLNKLLPKNMLMMLYNCLILPYFNYCIGTW